MKKATIIIVENSKENLASFHEEMQQILKDEEIKVFQSLANASSDLNAGKPFVFIIDALTSDADDDNLNRVMNDFETSRFFILANESNYVDLDMLYGFSTEGVVKKHPGMAEEIAEQIQGLKEEIGK